MAKAFVYGDNIDTDIIIAGRYLNSTDPEVLGSHAMEDLDPNFSKEVQKGDAMIAGENFGCGSSREHAPIALKACGVEYVIAGTFARIFYRNAINVGLKVLECKGVDKLFSKGDEVSVDWETGQIKNVSTGQECQGQAPKGVAQDIYAAGGIIQYVRMKTRGGN